MKEERMIDEIELKRKELNKVSVSESWLCLTGMKTYNPTLRIMKSETLQWSSQSRRREQLHSTHSQKQKKNFYFCFFRFVK